MMPSQTLHLVDALTGAYSRATLNERFKEEVERAHRYHRPLSLLFMDIDHFKSVNDGFGHIRGDEVLVEFTRRLVENKRRGDQVYRFGGDEFVVLLPETDLNGAAVIAQRLLADLQDSLFPGDPPLTISTSIGVGCYPQDGDTAEMVLNCADRRHYRAKQEGRGRVVMEDSGLPLELFLGAPPRLLERDIPLEVFNRFLDDLAGKQSGTLRVAGPAGSGKTRFFAEARKVAQIRDFTSLRIEGRYCLRSRMFGALFDGLYEWLGEDGLALFPHPILGFEGFWSALQAYLRSHRRTGLLIILDNLAWIDPATLRFVHSLAVMAQSQVDPAAILALAYTDEDRMVGHDLFQGVAFQRSINLEPLSPEGTRVWLRYSLHWEVPQPFLDWFYTSTGGVPGHILQRLNELTQRKYIHLANGVWTYQLELLSEVLPNVFPRGLIDKVPSHNLETLSEFIGREIELNRLRRFLTENNLVTLVGPGGVGKSSLAIQAAAENLLDFPDGAFHIPMEGLQTAADLVQAIGSTLHLNFTSGSEAQSQLLHYLRLRRVLLVLDNFENTHGIRRLLMDIFQSAQDVKVLVTSRQGLNLPGETVLPVNGLTYPETGNIEDMDAYSAVQLFQHALRRVLPEYELHVEDRQNILRICNFVGGSPLGIELVASWLKTLTLASMARAMEQNMAFLISNRGDLPQSHRSLYAVFDALWGMFSAEESRVLQRLSLFRGGFSEAAARTIAGASRFFLQALVFQSFLRSPAADWYELHELLRQYGSEKLHTYEKEERKARGQHSRFYLELAASLETRVFGKHAFQALHELQRDWDNIQQAWVWAVSQKELAFLSSSLNVITRFILSRDLLHQGELLFQSALAAWKDDQNPQARSFCIRMCVSQAALYAAEDNFVGAASTAQDALNLLEPMQDLLVETEARLGLAKALWRQGDMLEAQVQVRKAAALLRQAPQDHITAGLEMEILDCQGLMDFDLGRLDQAQAAMEQALALAQQSEELLNIGRFFKGLGRVGMVAGDFARARHFFEQLLDVSQQMGSRRSEAEALLYLGAVARRAGDFTEALLDLRKSLRMFQETGIYDHSELDNMIELGLLYLHRHDPAAAREYSQNAVNLARHLGKKIAEANALLVLGHACLALHLPDEAGAAYREVLEISDCSSPPERSVCLGVEALAGMLDVQAARGGAETLASEINHLLQELAALSDDQIVASGRGLGQAGEPLRVLLTCSQVLEQAGDPRASAVLQRGYHVLRQQAAAIGDEVLQSAFLENMPYHRELLQAWGKHPGAGE